MITPMRGAKTPGNAKRAKPADKNGCSLRARGPAFACLCGWQSRHRVCFGPRSREDAGLDHVRARRIVCGRRRQRSGLAEAAPRIDPGAVRRSGGALGGRSRDPSRVGGVPGTARRRSTGCAATCRSSARTLRWFYGLVIDPYPLTIRRADGRLIVEEVAGDAWSRTIDLSGQFHAPLLSQRAAALADRCPAARTGRGPVRHAASNQHKGH